MPNQPTTTFLTGSTGFIGQYVLRGLLNGGQRVIVLLRGPVAQSRLRLAALLDPLGIDGPHRRIEQLGYRKDRHATSRRVIRLGITVRPS